MKYKSRELRSKFLDFMKSKGHAVIPSAPVVPENDPTVLFNTAGMQPLVPYLLGQKHPLGTRLTDSQKCIRTNDIEEVGDNSHLTFFEMLGNWSLGDFFKEESITWSYELLTSPEWFGIDVNKIAVTVFEGDADAPRDEESAKIWEKTGIPSERISYLPKSENWWAAGDTGPCGPDTEIFYWVGNSDLPPKGSNVETDEDNWMEIWNNVFMEYNKLPDGTLEKLPAQNVDTGMGLERIIAVLNGEVSVYNTDVFTDIIEKISIVLDKEYSGDNITSMRIIADHIRTTVVMMSDGVAPSNVDQGYILRRLMRRAIRQAYKMDATGQFLCQIAEVVIEQLGDAYPNIASNRSIILDEIDKEEKQFLDTLEKGLKEFDKLVKGFEIAYERTGKKVEVIAGPKAFKLYDTYGFPLEMTQELATERGLKVDAEGFEKAYADHQAKSRAGSEQKFKGGLADDSVATTELHTATHLLLAGLNEVLGGEIKQKGSNITTERLRFDFNSDEKVQRPELDKIEEFVNEAIQAGTKITMCEMDKQQAIDEGVEGSFWEKYPEIVKVYTMKGNNGKIYSRELCGGPHVEATSEMGTFKIKKEEASSRGKKDQGCTYKIIYDKKKLNITTIGGGKGSYALLSSLRGNEDYNLSAIISMSDSGGSTGVLREEFGILPPGDVRRGVMALSGEHEIVKELFEYRYGKDSSVNGHSLGNLLITAMADITGSFDKGLKQICKMFKVKGRVIPVTLEQSHLNVKLYDGQTVEGETNIDEGLDENSAQIKKAYLTPPHIQANPKAIVALKKSDIIIISFGDLYTSIIPNLLVEGIKEAISENKDAKVIYFCNLMTKPGETTNFEAIDFISVIERYLGKDILDYVVVNNGYINTELAEKYKALEKKSPVKVKHHKFFRGKSYEVIEADLLHEHAFIRHSYDKIEKVVKEIIKK